MHLPALLFLQEDRAAIVADIEKVGGSARDVRTAIPTVGPTGHSDTQRVVAYSNVPVAA
jgi:hypothetical protein